MEIIRVPNLANACKLKKEYPDLAIVSRRDVVNLSVDDFVQLSHEGERFEVKIEEINDAEFIGTVRSDLVFNHPFSYGDYLAFTSDNVINLYGIASVETKMAIEVFKTPDKG